MQLISLFSIDFHSSSVHSSLMIEFSCMKVILEGVICDCQLEMKNCQQNQLIIISLRSRPIITNKRFSKELTKKIEKNSINPILGFQCNDMA